MDNAPTRTRDATYRLMWEQALAWRMGRHHLIERAAPSDLLQVAGAICGLHAQVMSSAELSLWARINGLERDAVREALWKHRTLPWVIGALIGKPTSYRCDAIVREPGHRRRIFSAQGWVSPVLLVDGQIAGVWKHTRQGRSLQVEIEPFGTLPDWATAQIEAEAERLAKFLGGALSLTWKAPVSP